jgi:hypothetical protein
MAVMNASKATQIGRPESFTDERWLAVLERV